MACNCNEGNTYHLNMGCCVPIVANANSYYTKSEIDEKLDEIIASGCCITPEEVDEKIDAAISGIDLSDYALKSEIPTVPTSNSAFTNDMQYITHTDLMGYINSLQSQITALNIALNECCGGSGDTGDTSDGKLFVRYANNTTKTLECGIENNVQNERLKPYYILVSENLAEQGNTNNITYAKVGDCVTTIAHDAFSGCTSLEKIDLPFESLNNTVSYQSPIDAGAFANTAIASVGLQGDDTTSVQLPSAITRVVYYEFSGCSSLITVELGEQVSAIDKHSFKGCTNLESITLHRFATITESGLSGNSLDDVGNNTFVIYVPNELVDTFKAASGWSNYANRIFPIP